MISVSNEYKQVMSRPNRNRAFISVGIGIINQNAQEDGKVNGDFSYWSYGNVFNSNQSRVEYATLEENFMKADGNMLFMPENDGLMQLNYNGITTDNVLGAIRIDFSEIYSIKGITLVFGSAYPTEFTVETAEKTLTYENSSESFVTNDVLGDTNYIIITPISMVGGQQRFRLQSVLMGVGLQYSNAQTKSFSHDDFVSSISEELPSESMSFSFYDENGLFDVDDESSFIDYLETMQKITLSFGVELDSGEIEWHQVATNYLKDWKSQKGVVTLSATDRLSQMEDEYSLGSKIYTRTAYQEAESIFADAGLQPDEYFIDDYLNDVTLTNPMPVGTHKACLQLLANACRCIIRQNENGRIMIVANFSTVLDPSDMTVSTNGVAEWSNTDNIFIGTGLSYADMTLDFMKADGAMYFLPEDETYLKTSYVSEQVADKNGLFEVNPQITLQLPASQTYYGINLAFLGNVPQEMVVHTYSADKLVGSFTFAELKLTTEIAHEFANFDKMVLEFTKGYPQNRVLVDQISFGSLSNYHLTESNMFEHPIGYKERRVKSVKVKVFTFENDENEQPIEVEDNVFVSRVVHAVGENKILQNPLVSTQEHANLLAEWIGNYYANNISYEVRYLGEPAVHASDIIYMENSKHGNIQTEVTSHKLSFNGAFSGNLELRRALNMTGG